MIELLPHTLVEHSPCYPLNGFSLVGVEFGDILSDNMATAVAVEAVVGNQCVDCIADSTRDLVAALPVVIGIVVVARPAHPDRDASRGRVLILIEEQVLVIR